MSQLNRAPAIGLEPASRRSDQFKLVLMRGGLSHPSPDPFRPVRLAWLPFRLPSEGAANHGERRDKAVGTCDSIAETARSAGTLSDIDEHDQAGVSDQVGLGSGFHPWWAQDPEPGPYVRDGAIVLDANVLLHLYRVTPKACEQILTTLTEVKERLWIPHQAALEFHRNRTEAVSGRLTQFREVRQNLQNATNKAAHEIRKAVLRLTKLRQSNMTERVWEP